MMKKLSLGAMFAMIFSVMFLTGCTVYAPPAQVSVGPPVHHYHGYYWVPGHYNRVGVWIPGHRRCR